MVVQNLIHKLLRHLSSKVNHTAEILADLLHCIIPAAEKDPLPTVHFVRVLRLPTIHEQRLPGRLK